MGFVRNSLIRPEDKGTAKFYLLGFILCIVLTLAAYFLVVEKLLSAHNKKLTGVYTMPDASFNFTDIDLKP